MKFTIVTTFNQDGLTTYGQRMIDTFEANWPKEVKLLVYTENCKPQKRQDNVEIIDLLDTSPPLREFIERHKNNPLAHGQAGPPDVFNPKKQFRWNAVRFSYKVFAVADAEKRVDSGWLIWLDADSVTHSTVPLTWLPTVCPQDSLASYLGRGENYHSECGWVGYNLGHPQGRQFIKDFASMYISDSIFNEREWHDSYIWDVVRKRYNSQAKFFNINPSPNDKGLAGHPFINSELGKYMDHVKGKRKDQGHSRSKEIVMHHDHPYWKKVLQGKK